MRKAILVSIVAFLLAAASASAEVFRFAYRAGEKYRIISRVHETVLVNGRFSHEADILNKIAVEVTDTRGDSGYHRAVFQTSERAYGSQASYEWSQEYTSLFWRNARGAYDIDPSYFMPVVRDVPLFPDGDVKPGQSWAAEGSESHDFRSSFGIGTPFHFPISVSYTYNGNETRGGTACAVIAIDYAVFQKVTPPSRAVGRYPVRITGRSEQKYWWDLANRRPVYYEEDFDFIFLLASGDEVEYTGSAQGELVESQPLDRAGVASEIQREIEKQGIPDVSVAPSDEGVTITMENVVFPPNSDELLPAEQEKLRRIAEILKKYPERDISITGHTARAPGYTEQDYQDLSEKRARAAGDFLLSLGALRPERMFSRGMGARVPVGDNDTEEGRRKNRRVEITILEN